MEIGQIRLNKATKEWVIYAPSRRQRPQDFQQKSQSRFSETELVENVIYSRSELIERLVRTLFD